MATTAPAYCTPDLSSFIPGCAALSSVAGVRTYFYAARLADLTITYGTDGGITGIAVKAGGKFAKYDGVKFQNSGAFELAIGTFGKSRWKHIWNFRAFYRSQASRNTLQNLARVQDLVVIAPNNDNLIEVYGAQVGLSPSSGKGGTGIKLDDDNTALFAFEGEEPGLPPLYSTVTTPVDDPTDFATNVAALDLLVNA
jgi:hypothetical protein